MRAISKNTFITFVANDADDSIHAGCSPYPKQAPRSRSAHAVRRRPENEDSQELSQQLLALSKRASSPTAVLPIGMSASLQQPQKECSEVGESMVHQPDVSKDRSDGQSGSGELSDLSALQARLAKASLDYLDRGASPHQKPCDKNLKDLPWKRWQIYDVCSSNSLSTMAPEGLSRSATPEDASDWGEPPSSGGLKLKDLKKGTRGWTSGSMSRMSTVDTLPLFDGGDSPSGPAEVEFDLDIEEGPATTTRNVPIYDLVCKEGGIAGRGSVSTEMSHGQVPRNHNMLEKYNSSKDEPPTTMMIRNIPGRYSQHDLMADLQELGFAGTYDFLYIPMDKGTSTNVGYAFVNFIAPIWAEKCTVSFDAYHFVRGRKRPSNKAACVSVAYLQGLENNLQHYENAAVNMSRDRRRKPVVLLKMNQLFA